MAYDWKNQAEREAPPEAEKVPAGVHELEIKRLVFGSKNGTFVSKGGDPQIMVIFADDQGREASQMYTLSAKAGWALARLLEACGVDMQRMEADDVEPSDFADEAFARANLMGRRLRAEVSWSRSPRDNKDYATLTPHRPDPTRPPAAPEPEAGTSEPLANGEEIPF